MTEIQGKSILVRVSEGSSNRESTVFIFSVTISLPLSWRLLPYVTDELVSLENFAFSHISRTGLARF